jgi:chemotaxis protein CheZ
MPEPRRVFRIEQTAAARRMHASPAATASPHHGEIAQALAALQALMAAAPAPPPAEAAAAREAAGVGRDPGLQAENMTRIAYELDAVTAGTAQATQKILAAAEEIDQLADNLSAALKGRLEQELAQDIADSVLRIFEACNFQDLIGQRVAKVMKSLTADDVAPAPAAGAASAIAPDLQPDLQPDLHGPRLDSDKGHMSQSDIDAMFDG